MSILFPDNLECVPAWLSGVMVVTETRTDRPNSGHYVPVKFRQLIFGPWAVAEDAPNAFAYRGDQ
jgi:hypothetical protein